MKPRLEDYIVTYKNWYSLEFCKETIAQLTQCKYSKHQFYTPSLDATSFENDFQTTFDVIPNSSVIMDQTWNAINQYLRIDFQFDWCNNWEGFSSPRFNHYTVGTTMKRHCDHIHSLFDGNRKGIPIISVLTILSDDYVGGELVFFTDTVYELHAGDVLIFPSNFLYPHKVNPITNGERYSCVSWVW